MVLYKENSVTESQAQNLSQSVTTCSGGTTPPPPTTPPTTNQAPTLSITSPSAGQNITASSNVTIGLSANDADGTIVKHEVFVNDVKVDTDGSTYSPYVITNIQAGSYTILATVTDNGGKTATSTVTISVTSGSEPTPNPEPEPPAVNLAPTVSFISPSAGQNFSAGDNVTIDLSASDADGTIVKHEVFVNNNLVYTAGSSFTPHIIPQISAGAYEIKATVTDNGGKTASITTNITVDSGSNATPTVAFTSLTEGQLISLDSTVYIQINANDTDGIITKHQVFIDNALVATDESTYTAYPFRPTEEGDYAIKVVVTDNQGATGEALVNITVGKVAALHTAAIAFPNPMESDGKVSVRFPEGTSGEFYYSVANGSGVLVEQGSFNAMESESTIDLQLSNVGRQSSGVYYLTLISRNFEQTIPIVRK